MLIFIFIRVKVGGGPLIWLQTYAWVFIRSCCIFWNMLYTQSNSNSLFINSGLWFSWLAGFIDAEGNFQVFKKNRNTYFNLGFGFHLSLHIRDHSILHDLQSRGLTL